MAFASRSTVAGAALAIASFALVAAAASADSLDVARDSSPAQQHAMGFLADSLLRAPGAMNDPEQIDAAFERAQAYRAYRPAWIREPADVAPIPLVDVQGGLDPGELWLGWVSGTDRTILFAITHDQRRAFSIAGVTVLSEKIRSARKTLGARPQGGKDTKSAQTAAEELARLVFGDALPLVAKARSLVFV